MWQIVSFLSFLGQDCLTLHLPLRERGVPDWNKGRERGECKKKSGSRWKKETVGVGDITKYVLSLERAKKCIMIYDYTSLIDYYSVLQRV